MSAVVWIGKPDVAWPSTACTGDRWHPTDGEQLAIARTAGTLWERFGSWPELTA